MFANLGDATINTRKRTRAIGILRLPMLKMHMKDANL